MRWVRTKVNFWWERLCAYLTKWWILLLLTIVASGITVWAQLLLDNSQTLTHLCKAFLNLVVAMTSGFVSAAVFYFIVNYCPFKKRQATSRIYVHNKMYRVCELLRQCRESVRNPLSFEEGWTKKLKREEYVNLFKNEDMHGVYPLFENMSLLEYLNNRCSDLYHVASDLLQYKEYLKDDEFRFIVKLVGSGFLMEGVIPDLDVEDDKVVCHCQERLGEEIYDLCEEGSKITSAYDD